MVTRKRRAKNEPTTGDLLAQAYRNRAAMRRVYDAAHGGLRLSYWTPANMDEHLFVKQEVK